MPLSNTYDSNIASDLLEAKHSSGGIGGALSGAAGMGDLTNAARDLREGKMGAAAMKAGEQLADKLITAYTAGTGKVLIKVAGWLGIPINKIVVWAVVGLVLFLGLIILAGGYAIVNKWEALKFLWSNII